MEDYYEYARIFNTGNDELLLSKFFSFPFTFTTPFSNQSYETYESFLKALREYHRVRECIEPHKVVYGKGELFVDLDIVFHSCVEWLDFPYGPVRPGDTLLTRGFVHYTLDSKSRIVHVAEMYWPAGYLNMPMKRLGGSDTQRAALDALIAGFNAGRFEAIGDYYTEDVTVEFPLNEQLVGRAKIVETYKSIQEKVKVNLEVKSAICDDSGICLTAKETFQALVDDPDFQIMPLKAGKESSRLILIVISLSGGLISSSKSITLE